MTEHATFVATRHRAARRAVLRRMTTTTTPMPSPSLPRPRPSGWAALMLVAACALPAAAAEPAKTRGAARPAAAASAVITKGSGSGPLMTRAELRECLARQDANRAEQAALTAEQEQVKAEKATLAQQAQAMKEQLETLDRTSAEAVARYNEQVGARDKAVEALLARTDAFNARVEAAQAGRQAYITACENRRYDERDEAAVRSGK